MSLLLTDVDDVIVCVVVAGVGVAEEAFWVINAGNDDGVVEMGVREGSGGGAGGSWTVNSCLPDTLTEIALLLFNSW